MVTLLGSVVPGMLSVVVGPVGTKNSPVNDSCSAEPAGSREVSLSYSTKTAGGGGDLGVVVVLEIVLPEP